MHVDNAMVTQNGYHLSPQYRVLDGQSVAFRIIIGIEFPSGSRSRSHDVPQIVTTIGFDMIRQTSEDIGVDCRISRRQEGFRSVFVKTSAVEYRILKD